jgi:hypothetical protein
LTPGGTAVRLVPAPLFEIASFEESTNETDKPFILDGLLGPPTKFTTLSPKNATERVQRTTGSQVIRKVVLSSVEGAVVLPAS